MRRYIQTVFEYTDYNLILLDDFTARTTHNGRYSLRAYARDLGLSPGYVSAVLRGKKNLNLGNWREVFLKIGVSQEAELKFIEKLLIYKISTDPLTQEESLKYIKDHYDSLKLEDKSDRDYFMDSPPLLIVYMILTQTFNPNLAKRLARAFGIMEDQFEALVSDLEVRNYIKRTDAALVVVDKNLAITSSQKILMSAARLSAYLFEVMKSSGGISFPQRSTHTLVLGFDQESFEQAIEVYKHFLHQSYRLSKNTKSIDRIAIFSDLLFCTSPENI